MVTQHVAIGQQPGALVYTPTPVSGLANSAIALSNVVFFNEGGATVYLGQQGVNSSVGLPLAPGAYLKARQMPVSVYAVSGVNTAGLTGVSNGTVAAAGTLVPVAAGGASYTNGMQLLLDTGAIQEIVTVGAGSLATQIVISAATFPHATAMNFSQITSQAPSAVHTESAMS